MLISKSQFDFGKKTSYKQIIKSKHVNNMQRDSYVEISSFQLLKKLNSTGSYQNKTPLHENTKVNFHLDDSFQRIKKERSAKRHGIKRKNIYKYYHNIYYSSSLSSS